MKVKLIKGSFLDRGHKEFERQVNEFIATHAVNSVSFSMVADNRAGIFDTAPNVLIFYEEK